MTQKNKCLLLLLFLFVVDFSRVACATAVPVLEKVLQNDFPAQPKALATTTEALLQEYKHNKNIASLIFYSYGMLRQANYFLLAKNFINASEYAKTGFFYLDEAVDSHEKDPRVRYLRARIDAYLPIEIGRCVVALKDTEILLDNTAGFDHDIVKHINYMRYRALDNCGENKQAKGFLAKVEQQDSSLAKYLDSSSDTAPAWDINEVTQILMPLLRGN